MNEKITISRTRYIVPFIYESKDDFRSMINRIVNLENWKASEEAPDTPEQDTYRFIREIYIMQDNKSNMGCSLEYQGKKDSPIKRIRYKKPSLEYIVEIVEMGLFLFRTGVGLLWYEVTIPTELSFEKLIQFQNDFKELSYEKYINEKGNISFSEVVEGGFKTFLMGHWISSEVLSELPIKVTYFAVRDDCIEKGLVIPDKSIIFNYLVHTEKRKDETNQLVYLLTNGYNRNYKCKVEIKNEFYEPFDNALCYATQGGCGYFALPDKDNSHFYKEVLVKKIMFDYFKLYILVLFQFYTILHITKSMESMLSAEVIDYFDESKKNLDNIRHIETEINVFLIKSIYSSVSHIEHQNGFYEYLMKRLRIKENIDSLTVGLASLRMIQETQEKTRLAEVEKKENKERELFDYHLTIGLAILSFLTLISAICDGLAISDVFIKLFGLSLYSRPIKIIVFTIIITAGLVALGIIARYCIGRNRKKRKGF